MKTTYKLDTTIKVEENLCIGCGSCIRTCPASVIEKKDFPFPTPTDNAWDQCIDCGHCVAICPTGAMHQRAMSPEDCGPIDIHLVPKWDKVKQFLTTRRSVRTYINKNIEKEKVELLLDVSRFAPNGANRQVLHWVVINDLEKVQKVAEMTIDWMKAIKEAKPALYEEANLEVFVSAWDDDHKDKISRGAPCIIMATAPKDERTAPPAAMIGIHQIQLAAHGLGLGTSFTGSINTAAQGYPPMIEMLGIPEGYIPFGTFVIGYPAENFHRIPVRKPVNVTWI
ncbi:MAG: nitroreductase family protein [Lutimonas sp.]